MEESTYVGTTVAEWVAGLAGNGGIEFEDQIRTYRDRRIVRVFDSRELKFPQRSQRYRNVMLWVLLDDGTSVGFNESPRSGYSFPRSGKKITSAFLDRIGASANPLPRLDLHRCRSHKWPPTVGSLESDRHETHHGSD